MPGDVFEESRIRTESEVRRFPRIGCLDRHPAYGKGGGLERMGQGTWEMRVRTTDQCAALVGVLDVVGLRYGM